ncbi:MAG: hypothetical protein ACFFC7_03810 [Candidatus Hermodarchaeota archaeon]
MSSKKDQPSSTELSKSQKSSLEKAAQYILPNVGLEEEILGQLNICVCLASFGDRGMAIQATGDNCQEVFLPAILIIIANYCAIFCQQSEGEHLFGSLPIPNIKISSFGQNVKKNPNLDDWYLMVYVFNVRDTSIKDSRTAQRGNITAGVFLIFYPRRFDQLIMQQKEEFKGILWKASSIIKDVESFTSEQMSSLEQKLQEIVRNRHQNITKEIESPFQAFAQIQMSFDYQRTNICERLDTLISLSKSFFTASNDLKNLKTPSPRQLGLLFIFQVAEIITCIQFHTPPRQDLDEAWQIQQSFSQTLELTIGHLRIWFLSPAQLSTVLDKCVNSETRIIGLYIGTNITKDGIRTNFNNLLNQFSGDKALFTLGMHHNIQDANISQLITKGQKWQEPLTVSPKGEFFSLRAYNVFSQLSWFYNIITERLMDYITQKRQKDAPKQDLLSQNERKALNKLLSRSLNTNENF